MPGYNKQEVLTFGDRLWDVIQGLKDGVGSDDLGNLVGALSAAPAISNEAKEDFDAFGLHLVAHLADKFGDARVNPPAPPTP